ncbi:MAG: PmbA/TldA family metallopeptidase, partial [Candidatus Hodarchaeota archaeon]
MTELTEKAQKILSVCQKKGTFDAEVYLLSSKQYQIFIDHNSISSQSLIAESGAGIRIVQNGKLGFSYTSSLDEKSVEKTVEQAIAIAKKTPGDSSNILPEASKIPEVKGLYSKEVADLKAEDVCSLGTQIIENIKSTDSRVTALTSPTISQTSNLVIVNTNGIEASLQDTLLNAALFGFARDGEKIGSFALAIKYSRKNDIDISKMVSEFVSKSVEGLKAQPLRGEFNGRVIFEPSAMLFPYLYTIILSIDGNNVFHNRSQWVDKIGEEVG